MTKPIAFLDADFASNIRSNRDNISVAGALSILGSIYKR